MQEQNEGELSQSIRNGINDNGANIVVLGELSLNSYKGEFSILIKYEELFTRRILFAGKIYVAEDLIDDKEYLNSQFRNIIPELDLLSELEVERNENRILERISPNTWGSSEKMYYESFSDRMSDDFLAYIWNKRNNEKYDYYVDENKNMYFFKIKQDDFIRHKYIQGDGLDYDCNRNPYSVNAFIGNKDVCENAGGCYGRGLTIAYNHSNKSCYAFILNNLGELKFIKVGNINNPSTIKILYTEQVEIESNSKYNLGIAKSGPTFHLYFGGEFITEIYNDDIDGDRLGVICIGRGNHYLDDISIFRSQ